MSSFDIFLLVVSIIICLAPLLWVFDSWLFKRKMRKDGWKDEWGWPEHF